MKHPLTTGVLVRGRDDAPASWAMGSLFERLASSQETEGAFGLSLVAQPPGTATPLHVHTQEAEAFYVLEGTLTYRAGEEFHRLAAGSFIYLPPRVPHAFRVTGTSPVRFLGLVVRAAFSVCTTKWECRRGNAGCRDRTVSRWKKRSGAGTRSARTTGCA